MIYYIEYSPATDGDSLEYANIKNHFYNCKLNEVIKTEYHDYVEYTIDIEHPGPIHEALGEGIRLITAYISKIPNI